MKTIAVLLSVVAAAVALEPCVCNFDYRPVCGSDGRTYGNLCGLKCEQRTDSTLTLAYHGECKAVVEKRSEELCVCTDDLRPVCGTDAVTYDNQCLLGCARRTDASIYVLYEGVCKKNQEPICICTLENKPVCGSDNVSYGNKCFFDCARRTNPDLYIVNHGDC